MGPAIIHYLATRTANRIDVLTGALSCGCLFSGHRWAALAVVVLGVLASARVESLAGREAKAYEAG